MDIEKRDHSFHVLSNVAELRALRKQERRSTRVSLVPTMGALHDGHLELIRQAATNSDNVYISIFVNPTQFGPNEDLSTYPRTLSEDLEKLKAYNKELVKARNGTITCVFTPKASEMYPMGLEDLGHVIMSPRLTQVLEGKARPTFFQGVTTVVMKLLNIVEPQQVYFGQKDIQQLVILNRMVKEFHVNTQVFMGPTRRLESGVAMSSRNAYLGERRMQVAPVLYRSLRAALEFFMSREKPRERSELLPVALQVAKRLQEIQRDRPASQRARFELEYLSLTDSLTLKEVDWVGESGAILSGAVVMLPLEEIQEGERLGTNGDSRPVRLIDNMLLGFPANTSDVPFLSEDLEDRKPNVRRYSFRAHPSGES